MLFKESISASPWGNTAPAQPTPGSEAFSEDQLLQSKGTQTVDAFHTQHCKVTLQREGKR